MMLRTFSIEVTGDRDAGSQLVARCLDAFGVAPKDTEYGDGGTFMLEFEADVLSATIVCLKADVGDFWKYGITVEPKDVDPDTWALMCSSLSAPLDNYP